MENKEETIYFGLVGRIRVEGKTYKEFTLNYLQAIKETYKDLPDDKRLQAYIEYFVNNFSYDKEERDKRRKNNQEPETKEFKEKKLFELFYTNKGVCEQFSVGLSLLCKMDEEINKYYKVYYANCKIESKLGEDNHGLNLLAKNAKDILIIDLSAMIHCKEKDNVGEIWDYGVVSIENYNQNQKRNNFKLIPNADDGSINLLIYRRDTTDNVEDYYELLTQPAEVLNGKLRDQWVVRDITENCKEKTI